jgi:hypothetical protein
MQVCKSLTSDAWDEGEKVEKPGPRSELVFRTAEHHAGYQQISYQDRNGMVEIQRVPTNKSDFSMQSPTARS